MDLALFLNFPIFGVILKLLDNFYHKLAIMLIFENGTKSLFLLCFLVENQEISPDPLPKPVAIKVPCVS